MAKHRQQVKSRWQSCRPLLAAAIALGGSFNLVNAVLAEGTAAGTPISNTATATYNDSSGTILRTESNTVTVTVAEIAGITITSTGVVNTFEADGVTPGNGTYEPGDTLVYSFNVTNVGNDPTQFNLTNLISTTGPVEQILSVRYDSNGDGIIDATDATLTGRADTRSVGVGESVRVEVTVKVSNGAVGNETVTVRLGDTNGDAQNQPFDGSAGSVYTVDNTGTDNGDASADPPANGIREASRTASITLGAPPQPSQPLVLMLKQINGIDDKGTPALTDDEITYGLTVDMQEAAPAGSNVTPSDLQAISISVNGSRANHVLVSDAVPAGMQLATAPTAPANWQVVYSVDDPTITSALGANWTTTQPPIVNIRRVGFIFTANQALARTAPNVNFTVTFINTAGNSTVANLAQVFGSGRVDDPATPGINETLSFPVLDESGDRTPSNYNSANGSYSNINPAIADNPATETREGFTPGSGYFANPNTIPPGQVDPGGSTPADPSDDNTGTPNNGAGEPIRSILAPPTQSAVLNGPNGTPGAIGPTNDNDDFTNKSTTLPANGNPDLVGFTNTVRNTSATSGTLTLKLDNLTSFGDLPNNTVVTLITPTGTRIAYTYNATDGTWDNDGNAGTPVSYPSFTLAAGAAQNYGVEVDLPAGTNLTAYPVTITAELDNGSGPIAVNKTINRVYTGFLRLDKTFQIVRGDGPAVANNRPAPGNQILYRIAYSNISEAQTGTMTGNVTLNALNVDVLEDGTIAACASAPANSNNWAVDNDNSDGDSNKTTQIDTSHVLGSVNLANVDPGSTGSVGFYGGAASCNSSGQPIAFVPASATPVGERTGSTTGTDITRYLIRVNGPVSPGESGYVEFARRVN